MRRGDSLEREALALATNGFEVFPVTPGGKAPPLVKFTQQASGDPVEIAAWWRKHPMANIGVRPGGGTLILDADSKAALRFVDRLELPETTTVATPRGGRHLYFKGSAPTKAGVRPGLDVRGRGGYAVGPGSVVKGQRYEWVIPPWKVPPKPAPEAVLELVNESAKREVLQDGPIPKGRRNTTLNRIAGSFVRHGIRGEGLRAALHILNRERCKPPLSETEVERVFKSASKWDVPPQWVLDPTGFAEDPKLDAKARLVLLVLAGRANHEARVRGGTWLEQVTGLSRHSIYRAVDELERWGRVKVDRTHKRANEYELLAVPRRGNGSNSGKGVATCDTWELGHELPG
jgi:Bifunctional DNA primase/polymerase, N-terminal/Primase C terminal 1 (PriCT-1)